MVRLEGFMDIQQLHHDGVSVSEIARQLNMDRKTVRKYLRQAPRKYERKPKCWKIDPFRAYLRERWELGVVNASRLFVEIQKRGYAGGVTQVRAA
jgi:transposase